jgi:hypothetical protein
VTSTNNHKDYKVNFSIDTGIDYNDVFNSSSSSAIYTDYVGKVNLSLDNDKRAFIFTYSADTDPKPTSIATSVTDVGYEYTTNSELIYTSTGGTSILSQMSDISRVYEVLEDGAHIEYTDESTYSVTSKTLTFRTSGINSMYCANVMEDYIIGFAEITGLIGLVVIISIFVLLRFRSEGKISFSFKGMMPNAKILISLGFLVALGIIMLSILIRSGC